MGIKSKIRVYKYKTEKTGAKILVRDLKLFETIKRCFGSTISLYVNIKIHCVEMIPMW